MAVALITTAILFIAALIQCTPNASGIRCSLFGISVMYVLMTDCGSEADKLIPQQKAVGVVLESNEEDISRNKITQTEVESRPIAKGKQDCRETYSRELLRRQNERSSPKWIQDAEHHCLEVQDIEERTFGTGAETGLFPAALQMTRYLRCPRRQQAMPETSNQKRDW